MKQRILSCVLAVMLILGVLPAALASEEYAAYIGETGYAALDEAVMAAKESGTDAVIRLSAGEHELVCAELVSENRIWLPASLTINGEEGAVITNGPAVAATDLTVQNVDFIGSSYVAAQFHLKGTSLIEDCTLIGPNGTYYSTVNDGTVTFRDCIITGDVYGLHVGEGSGSVIIDNCEVTGWNSYGVTGTVTITDTSFHESTDGYAKLRFYQNASVSGCVFEPTVSIDAGSGIDAVFTSCTVTDDSDFTDLIERRTLADAEITVDDVLLKVHVGDTPYNTLPEALNAAENGDTVILTYSTVLESTLAISGKNITLDLNGHTLTLASSSNTVKNNADLTITNGTLVFTGTEGGDGLLGIGTRGNAADDTKLTLDGVTVRGDGYNSGAGVFFLYSGDLDITDSVMDFRNEMYTESDDNGTVIYTNSDAAESKVTITDSELIFVDVIRGFQNGDVTITDSEISMSSEGGLFLHGFNVANVTLDNSKVTISGGEGHGIRLNGNTFTVGGASQVKVSDMALSDIRFMSGGGKVIIEDCDENTPYGALRLEGVGIVNDSEIPTEELFDLSGVPCWTVEDGQLVHNADHSTGLTPPDGMTWEEWFEMIQSAGKQWYSITAEFTEGGEVLLSDELVLADSSVTVTVVPDEGYAIGTILINGKETASAGEFVIRTIRANQKIEVTFVKLPWENPYTDVDENSEYYDAIRFVTENGIFIGTGNDRFEPDAAMTRAMFVTVFGRMADVNPSLYEASDFTDVIHGAWYASYVAWAQKCGIVLGYGDGTYGVEDDVTIEQAAAIFARYAAYAGMNISADASLEEYSDAADVSEYAREALAWLIAEGIYVPTDGRIKPQESASRALIAGMICKFASSYGE